MYVSLLFDVEDLISTRADDDTREVAETVSSEGLRATFCVVGERVRQWRERGRNDVVDSLARHDLGFHTDLHSVHPTVVEYLADKGWEDGVDEVLRREEAGIQAFRELFGRMPSCWGGPGNTWGPQVSEAMRRIGVPAVVYAHTRVPRGDVHRFSGILHYQSGVSINDVEYHLADRWRSNLERVLRDLETRAASGAEWTELFMGHPSRIFTAEFWDGPSFSGGRNPPASEWVPPRRKPSDEAAAALRHFRDTLRAVRSLGESSGIRVRTIAEMNALFVEARAEVLSTQELEQAGSEIDQSLARMPLWPILPPQIDTSRIRELTRQRLDTLRRLRLPR